MLELRWRGQNGCYLSLAKTAFGSAMLHSSTMSMCRSSAAVQMRALNVSAENDPVLADDSELTEDRSHAMRQRASACKKVTLINLHVDGLPSKQNTHLQTARVHANRLLVNHVAQLLPHAVRNHF